MKLYLSWILAMITTWPLPLPAQQEALLLKIFTEVQKSSHPTIEKKQDEPVPAPMFENIFENFQQAPEPEMENGEAAFEMAPVN